VFQALVASGPQTELGAYRFVLSVGVHGALIAVAITLTRHPSAPTHSRRPDPAILFLAPEPVRNSLPIETQERPSQSGPVPPAWQLKIRIPDLNPVVLPATVPTVEDLLHRANINSGLAPGLRGLGVSDATSMAAELLTAAAVDDPVGIIQQPDPRYPAALAQAQVTGHVELAYVVDTVGRVEPGSLRTLMSTHPAFEAAVQESVLASRYRPARLRGRAVRQLVRQTFNFRLGE
jgi:TonB family protein